MPVPTEYDVALQHSTVNAGTAVGFLLDEQHAEALVEERSFVTDVQVTTGGVVTVASYGAGPVEYRLRLLLRSSVMRRNSTGAVEVPATLRTNLLAFAAANDTLLELWMATGDRRVAFVKDGLKFLSHPSQDGYVALLHLVDLGAG